MAWDTQRTKKLLLDAAIEEFAAKGPEAARVAQIATRAGVNKERIYQYFGNKDGLFRAVLASELSKLAEAVPLAGEAAADLGDYTARVFDYHRQNPHFLRLLAWEGLHRGPAPTAAAGTAPAGTPPESLPGAAPGAVAAEGAPEGMPKVASEVVSEGERTEHYARKVAAIGAAQDAGNVTGEVPADHLMYAVIALTAGWFNLPQLVQMVAPATAAAEPEAQREAVAALVRRLASRP
ncbi:TetR family transcriptional regulator [Streptomyces sp. ISL-66]|uniref:TetR/AcrR family transcriptional regulator n=1 Tax=Streptomyces sp. ISL-66 TaxID=2819186 RepID=UPI001BE91A31|nr:TetR family transcriptional regulator [Streptomyces sp. ISL-66]MBT2470912.1 TetR family transcriptional regulator [Streptomyces sp. ISL-66]